MIRIATAGFQHESNVFSAVPATWAQFERAGILRGAAMRAEYEASRSSLAGFWAVEREDPGVRIEPLVFSRLTPMGAITGMKSPLSRKEMMDGSMETISPT